jgi:hypothetical protein
MGLGFWTQILSFEYSLMVSGFVISWFMFPHFAETRYEKETTEVSHCTLFSQKPGLPLQCWENPQRTAPDTLRTWASLEMLQKFLGLFRLSVCSLGLDEMISLVTPKYKVHPANNLVNPDTFQLQNTLGFTQVFHGTYQLLKVATSIIITNTLNCT